MINWLKRHSRRKKIYTNHIITSIIISFIFSNIHLIKNPIISQVKAQEIIGGATGVPKNSAGYKKWTIFQNTVEKKSLGKLIIKPMITGELGSEENILLAVRRGRIQIANLSSMVVSSIIPEAMLLQIPFLFNSQETAEKLFDTVLFDPFNELLKQKDIKFLSWDEVGFHQIYSVKPIFIAEDLRGIRFRTSSSIVSRLIAESLSVDIISIPYTDLVTGLQTGLVRAGENAVILYTRTGVSNLAPHLTITNHSFATNFIIANSTWFNNLDHEEQKIIESSYPSKMLGRTLTKKEWQEDLENADKLGFTIHTISEKQKKGWIEKLRPVKKEIISLGGNKAEEIYKIIQNHQ